LRRMLEFAVRVFGDVTEGVDTKFDLVNHAPLYQVQSGDSWRHESQPAHGVARARIPTFA
jgi:hypothetical protein